MLTSKAAEVRGGRAWPSWVGLLHHQGFSPAAHCGSSSLAIVLFWWDLDTEYVPRVVGQGPRATDVCPGNPHSRGDVASALSGHSLGAPAPRELSLLPPGLASVMVHSTLDFSSEFDGC